MLLVSYPRPTEAALPLEFLAASMTLELTTTDKLSEFHAERSGSLRSNRPA